MRPPHGDDPDAEVVGPRGEGQALEGPGPALEDDELRSNRADSGSSRTGHASRKRATNASLPALGPPACALEALDARWPGMRDRLCDSRPAIRRHINVFVNGDRATLATKLPPGAEMVVTTAISGG